MDIYICTECGVEVKHKKPEACPFCGCKEFDKRNRPDPTEDDKKYTKLYDEVIDKLDEYTEDCDPFDSKTHSNGE